MCSTKLRHHVPETNAVGVKGLRYLLAFSLYGLQTDKYKPSIYSEIFHLISIQTYNIPMNTAWLIRTTTVFAFLEDMKTIFV